MSDPFKEVMKLGEAIKASRGGNLSRTVKDVLEDFRKSRYVLRQHGEDILLDWDELESAINYYIQTDVAGQEQCGCDLAVNHLCERHAAERFAYKELGDWIQERMENCKRIAGQKTDEDKERWLDDAWHFEQVLSVLRKREAAALASQAASGA